MEDLKKVDKLGELFAIFDKQFQLKFKYKIVEIMKNETHYFIEYEIYMIIDNQQIHLTNMSASFTIEEYKKINEENFNQFIMTGLARNIITGFQLMQSFREQSTKLENDDDKPKILLQN